MDDKPIRIPQSRAFTIDSGCTWLGVGGERPDMQLYDHKLPEEHQYVGHTAYEHYEKTKPPGCMPAVMWFDLNWLNWLAEQPPDDPPVGFLRWEHYVAVSDKYITGVYVKCVFNGRPFVWVLVGTQTGPADHVLAVWND